MTLPPQIQESTAVRRSDNVYERPFGEELVLLHFGRGEYYGLDSTGAHIWNACAGGATVRDVATSLATQFDISYEQALADVVALVGELCLADLVTI